MPQRARRRIGCLRREEVAWVAEVGITWYTWLEQGRPIKIAAGTLGRIAAALRLDPSETEYLRRLAQTRGRGKPSWERPVEPSIRDLVEGYTSGYALVTSPRWDILARNEPFARLFGVDGEASGLQRNVLWFMFTQERARGIFPNWREQARAMVAMFRVEYADYVGDSSFAELIETLSRECPEFAAMWSDVDVLLPLRWQLGQVRDPESGFIRMFDTVNLPVPGAAGQKLTFHYPAHVRAPARAPKAGRVYATTS